MSNIQTEIPNQLWQQAQILVQQGWASNLQEVINEALRRYLESHQDVLTEAFTGSVEEPPKMPNLS